MDGKPVLVPQGGYMIQFDEKFWNELKKDALNCDVPFPQMLRTYGETMAEAFRRTFAEHDYLNVHTVFDTDAREIGIFVEKDVVLNVVNVDREIGFHEAKQLVPNVILGEKLDIEITPSDLSILTAAIRLMEAELSPSLTRHHFRTVGRTTN